MSLYLCLGCGNVFDDRVIRFKRDSNGDILCPIANCADIPFEVDELMIYPLKKLNKKGYYTLNSCSSHIYEGGDLYIMFNPLYKPATLPEGYTSDDKYGYCIRYDIEGERYSTERLDSIHTGIKNLMEWVDDLPDAPEIYYDETDYSDISIPSSIASAIDECKTNDELKLLLNNIQTIINDKIWRQS